MANLSIRRGEPRGSLAGMDPFRMMEPFRSLDPFRLLRDLMVADPFAGAVPAVSEMFAPEVEIKETKDSFMLSVDLPGVREQDIEVSITGNRLTVSGRREEEQRREEDRYFAYERSYGAFSRSFVLPDGADLNNVKAELRDGVLNIIVPKKAEMQPRRVEVSGKESGAKEITTGQSGEKAAGQPGEKITGQPGEKKAA